MPVSNKKKKPSGQQKYSAPAVEKSLDILELLSREPNISLSLTDISTALNKTKAEIFRMVMVLLNRGYVEYSPRTKNYRLSHRMFEISHQHVAVKSLTHAAASVMSVLAAIIHQNCHIVVYSQGRSLVLAQQEAQILNERLSVPVGNTKPLLGSSAGHIILTYANEEERGEMLTAAGFNTRGHNKINSDLNKIIKRINNKGYEILPNPILKGVTDIGFPLYNHADLLSGVLVVSYIDYPNTSDTPDIDHILPDIAQAASNISANLGHFPETDS